jgi:hypothetical protein
VGLRDEWKAMRDAVERVAKDLTHLTTVTKHTVDGEAVAMIASEVQFDGDTAVIVSGDAVPAGACHRAAVTFTAELASARLRMIARVAKAIIA